MSARTRETPPAEGDSGRARTHRDSLVESRRHLPKGAKTDTGFRPRAVTPRDSGAARDST
ncbi:MAG TPA: hypothetical protein VFS44_14475 [Gemmatimonadaceae bacterium]|nr:hypothetical protein [Gemmatimonadaceae bacterium]